jgi:AbrB family looped-hinge helix DNA binding protein
MEQVTISSKYQIVIPLSLRKEIKIKPGQKVFIYNDNGSIRIEQKIKIKDYFGIAKGVDPAFERENEDRT